MILMRSFGQTGGCEISRAVREQLPGEAYEIGLNAEDYRLVARVAGAADEGRFGGAYRNTGRALLGQLADAPVDGEGRVMLALYPTELAALMKLCALAFDAGDDAAGSLRVDVLDTLGIVEI